MYECNECKTIFKHRQSLYNHKKLKRCKNNSVKNNNNDINNINVNVNINNNSEKSS